MLHFSRLSILLILIASVLSSCTDKTSMPGKAFEGKIVQQITIDGSSMAPKMVNHDTTYTAPSSPEPKSSTGMGLNATITMYVRADKVAYDMSVLGGLFSVKSIIDRNARTMTMLAGKHAYVTNLRAADAKRATMDDSLNAHADLLDSLDQMLPKPTGNKQTIAGFECEEYKGTFKGMEMDMWITQDPRLKFYDVIRDAILGRNRTGAGGMEQVMALLRPIAGEGKVPVKMTITKDGKAFIKSEMKEMSEEKLDDSIFEVPKDFEVIKNDDGEKGEKK